jgi:hypothetical protein
MGKLFGWGRQGIHRKFLYGSIYGNIHLGDQEGFVRIIYKPFENRMQGSKLEGTDSRLCREAG